MQSGLNCFASSVVSIVPSFTSGLVRRLYPNEHGRYMRLALPKIQLSLILFSLAFVLNQTLSIVNEFRRNTFSLNQTNVLSFSFEIEPVSFVLCFQNEVLMFPDEAVIREKRNSELLQDNSFDQIERLTNSGLDQMIERIDLSFGTIDKSENLRKEVSSDVMFKNESYKSFRNGRNFTDPVLVRCFRLNFHVSELRYNRIIPLSYLFILFRNRFSKIFIIGKHQKFDSSRDE